MTSLEIELLNEIERLQTEILRLQTIIEQEQTENEQLNTKYEKLLIERTTLYYKDLAESFKQDLENTLLAHKSELDNLEKEQSDIEQTKTELNNLLQTYSTMDYNKLERDFIALQMDYKRLENDYQALQTILKKSLTDMEIAYQKAYKNQMMNLNEIMETEFMTLLEKYLHLVDLKLNEN